MDLPLKRKERESTENGEEVIEENELVKKKCGEDNEEGSTCEKGNIVETIAKHEEEFNLIEYLKSNEDDVENVSSDDSNDSEEEDDDDDCDESEESDDDN